MKDFFNFSFRSISIWGAIALLPFFLLIIGIIASRDILPDGLSSIPNFNYAQYIRNNCEEPLGYKLGNIDARFGISNETIIETLKEAEDVWEKAYGANLFEFSNSEDSISVNFYFDERQQNTISKSLSNESIDQKNELYDNAAKTYEVLLNEHNKKANEQLKLVEKYEAELAIYNKRVDEWNRGDRSSKTEYESLNEEAKKLEKMRILVNTEASRVNESKDKLAVLYSELESLRITLNYQVGLHNDKYNREAFAAGDYDGLYRINVYQYDSLAILRQTLTHELGHSIGIGHADSPKSIMYWRINSQNINSLVPTVEDLSMLSQICD